jgi:hypothetical protein
MGLSVTVYENVQITDSEDFDFCAYVIDDSWKCKIENLKYGAKYTGYAINNFSYSYRAHGFFRAYLLKIAGREDLIKPDGRVDYEKLYSEKSDNIPFFDLIDFADNEGCLDWDFAKKILKDFESYAGKRIHEEDVYMYNVYSRWHKAFKLASECNGVICFS